MSTVQPIIKRKHIKKCGIYIRDNFDPAYHLIYLFGIDTGFRITDITEMKYSNFCFDTNTVSIIENKGLRAKRARARVDAMGTYLSDIVNYYRTDAPMFRRATKLKAREVYGQQINVETGKPSGEIVFNDLVPREMRDEILLDIKVAVNRVSKAARETDVDPKIMSMLKERQAKYKDVDDGNIFARSTLASNRAKSGAGVITRQACWRVFSKLSGFLSSLGTKVKIAAHSLRKCFARTLYESSNNNIGLVMTLIGHSSPEMSLRYIAIDKELKKTANDNRRAWLLDC